MKRPDFNLMHNQGGHLILTGIPAWGHLRPLAAFAAKIVEIQADCPPIRRTMITLLTAGELTDKIKRELAVILEGTSGTVSMDGQIRVVSMGGEGNDYVAMVTVLFAKFPQYYDLLLAEKPIICERTGKVYDAIPKPSAAVIDFTAAPIFQAIEASKMPIPIVTSAPVSATTMFHTIAPEGLCGLGEAYANIEAACIKGDKTEEELNAIIHKVNFLLNDLGMPIEWLPNTGRIIQIPGLQNFFDYEKSPQEPSTFTWTLDVLRAVHHGISNSAGMILHTTPAYEPEALPAVRSLLEKSGKKLFAVGPLVPSHKASAGESHKEGSPLEDPDRVVVFLDAAFKRHGSHSVLYISFGSAYWPTNPHFLRAWIEGLLERGIPFILTTASMSCNLPEDLRSQIENSEQGLLSAWAPQHVILAHPATGWFMSHCGHNSVMEAMSAGVPVIAWPIEADQPFEAAYVSLTLDAGFELVQVRDGVRGLRPLYRGINSPSFVQPRGTLQAVREELHEILRRAWADEGKIKRENADAAKAHLQAAWGVEGDSRKSLESFLEQFAVV